MKRFLTLALAIGFFAVASLASAATTPNSVVTAQTPNRIIANFGLTASCTAATQPYTCCTGSAAGCVAGTNYTLYTAGANGSKCNSLWMNNSDTVTHAVTFAIVNSTTPLTKGPGTILTTTASGVSGTFTIPQAVLSLAAWPGPAPDSDGNPYLALNSGDTLVASFATGITSGDVIAFGGSCADF